MQLTLSHSQLSRTNCGRKFELSYIHGLTRKEGVHSRSRVFGSAFHAGMAELLTDLYTDEPILTARLAAIKWVDDNAIEDKQTYDGQLDVEYYDMLNLVKHEVGVLLEWFIPNSNILTRYEVATMHDVFGTSTDCEQGCFEGTQSYACGYCDNEHECERCNSTGTIVEECGCIFGQLPDLTPIIEYEFDYAINDTVNLRGYIDAILYDKELQEYIIVDWKTRANIGDELMTMLDAQLQIYAYAIRQMGGLVDRVRMWEVRTTPPMPAKINKPTKKDPEGKPSIAANASATTREVWLTSLTDAQVYKWGNPEFVDTVKSIKPMEYFIRESDERVSDNMLELTFQNVIAQATQIEAWHKRYENNENLPALLSSYACRGCDFLQLCANPFHHGHDASALIDEYYEYKDGYQPEK